MTRQKSTKKQSIKHRLTRLLSTSKPDVHKETAGEIKRKLSIRTMGSGLRLEIKRRGIQKYLSSVNQFTDEETDVEVIHERKNILMSEMEYIFEKLLQKEKKGAKRMDFSSDEEKS